MSCASFGLLKFCYKTVTISKISDTLFYEIYQDVTLSDGTHIGQISVSYDHENYAENRHTPTISIHFEGDDGAIYRHPGPLPLLAPQP